MKTEDVKSDSEYAKEIRDSLDKFLRSIKEARDHGLVVNINRQEFWENIEIDGYISSSVFKIFRTF